MEILRLMNALQPPNVPAVRPRVSGTWLVLLLVLVSFFFDASFGMAPNNDDVEPKRYNVSEHPNRGCWSPQYLGRIQDHPVPPEESLGSRLENPTPEKNDPSLPCQDTSRLLLELAMEPFIVLMPHGPYKAYFGTIDPLRNVQVLNIYEDLLIRLDALFRQDGYALSIGQIFGHLFKYVHPNRRIHRQLRSSLDIIQPVDPDLQSQIRLSCWEPFYHTQKEILPTIRFLVERALRIRPILHIGLTVSFLLLFRYLCYNESAPPASNQISEDGKDSQLKHEAAKSYHSLPGGFLTDLMLACTSTYVGNSSILLLFGMSNFSCIRYAFSTILFRLSYLLFQFSPTVMYPLLITFALLAFNLRHVSTNTCLADRFRWLVLLVACQLVFSELKLAIHFVKTIPLLRSSCSGVLVQLIFEPTSLILLACSLAGSLRPCAAN
jgi:hypothetical protein